MTETLVIARRFCGPPDSGNGGYVCGRIASHLDGPAEITLRRPPPLGTSMTVENARHGLVHILDGDTVVAEGRRSPDSLPITAPPPISIAEARAAGAASMLRVHPEAHPFPTCFVCGPQRQPGDGMNIMVGLVAGSGLSADVWCPDGTLTDADGSVRPEFLWAALDCAGGIGALAGGAPSDVPFVLGRFAVRQLGPVRAGEPYVVAGWRLAENGRKVTAGSAAFRADGQPVGIACATWVQLRAMPQQPAGNGGRPAT
jgi:hypothetical protein